MAGACDAETGTAGNAAGGGGSTDRGAVRRHGPCPRQGAALSARGRLRDGAGSKRGHEPDLACPALSRSAPQAQLAQRAGALWMIGALYRRVRASPSAGRFPHLRRRRGALCRGPALRISLARRAWCSWSTRTPMPMIYREWRGGEHEIALLGSPERVAAASAASCYCWPRRAIAMSDPVITCSARPQTSRR
jgi:hypothetical protein